MDLELLGPLGRLAGVWEGDGGLDGSLCTGGTYSYDEDTVLEFEGRDEVFHHTDRNVLRRVDT